MSLNEPPAHRPQTTVHPKKCRGVGKTVLLNELADAARQDGWIVGKIEADLGSGRTPFRNQVAATLNAALRHARGKPKSAGRFQAALRTFKSFSLGAAPDGTLSIGIELDPERGRADTGSLQADLSDLAIDLGGAAVELGVGTVLLIDEMQHLDLDELAAICQACHETVQRNLPFFVIGAGLPNLPGVLAEAKSYSERLFHYVRIDRLQRADAIVALTAPAVEESVGWDEDAVDLVVDASGGIRTSSNSSGRRLGPRRASHRLTSLMPRTGSGAAASYSTTGSFGQGGNVQPRVNGSTWR